MTGMVSEYPNAYRGAMPEVRRTFDAKALNPVANHHQVRPWLGGDGDIDLTAQMLNADNFALVVEGGGFMCVMHEPGVYEVHSMFLPEARRGTAKAMQDAMDYMFSRTDCLALITQVPDNNPAAAALAAKGGFGEWFRRADAPLGHTSYRRLGIETWAQSCDAAKVQGEWLHGAFDDARMAAGVDWPDHPDDPAHIYAAGAACMMMKAANIAKGTAFYNQWARFAGYPLITLIQHHPPTIDMSAGPCSFVVEIRDSEMEVLLCRSD